MTSMRLTGALIGALILLTGAAHAQMRAEVVSLGRSGASGAVCQAVRDYDDPLVQAAGRRAWTIRCRGWDAALGKVYALPGAAAEEAWSKASASRAACTETRAQALGGVSAARRTCRAAGSNAPYLTYAAHRGGTFYAAEGPAQVADILETALRVASGAAKPPKDADVQTSAAGAEIAADFGGQIGGLARAQAAAASDPERLRVRGYVQNNEWNFEEAGANWQALASAAEAANASPGERADALFNLALNVSNTGAFAEADVLFAEAEKVLDQGRDPILVSRALNYRALHLRNQGKFAEAVTTAQASLAARQQIRADRGIAAGPTAARGNAGEVVIGPDLARALNQRTRETGVTSAQAPTTAERLAVYDAQAQEIIGSAKAAGGDAAGAREAYDRGLATLVGASLNGPLNVWLQARLEADIAALEQAAGQAGAAADRFARADAILRRRHAGSSAEGALLLQLAGAQAAAGRQDAALDTYAKAFAIFEDQRGGLGASADGAQGYFDLLLARIQSDPAKAADYTARFFTAAESVVNSATAQTVSKLAARVASGDSAVTGLVRALEDTKRLQRAAESRIATLQAEGGYTGEAKAAADAELASLQAQADGLEAQLFAANPRYSQLVSSKASLADLQKALRPDEAFAKIVLLRDKGYGLLVANGRARPYAIALTRDQAVRAAEHLRAPFEDETLTAYDVAAARDLFVKLFGPVQADLLAARHLVYEPDGALISLPVAMLVTDDASVALMRGRTGAAAQDYRGVQWLGAKADSSLVLSAASFLQSRAFRPSMARQTYLAFADPASPAGKPQAFEAVLQRGTQRSGAISAVCEGTRQALMQLPALPDTADEIRRVGASLGAAPKDLITGASFSDGAVEARGDLADYRVLYFATHGLLPQPTGCLPEPALVTSVGMGASDGLLEASEIVDLKLDADLVVLSACDTGGAGSNAADRTGLQGGGEALGGLARAVIYAGGRALIVSHWSVDSDATVRLMTGLFGSGAASQGEAMQRAQAALQQAAATSHPFFWAPFTIVGDAARPLPQGASPARVAAR